MALENELNSNYRECIINSIAEIGDEFAIAKLNLILNGDIGLKADSENISPDSSIRCLDGFFARRALEAVRKADFLN